MPEHQFDSTRSDTDLFHTSPMEQVREGMTVQDAHGARLGKVKRLRMGDPEAVTTAGQGRPGGPVAVAVAPATNSGGTTGFGGSVPVTDLTDEPDVPDPLRTRLRRVGFIELEDSDLHGPDAYLPGDRISHVQADVVYLRMEDVSTGEQQQHSQFSYLPDDTTPRKLDMSRERMAIAAGGGLAVASVGGIVGAWQYREWQRRQRRPDVRAKRWAASVGDGLSEGNPRTIGGVVGSTLMLAVLMRTLMHRPGAETSTLSDFQSDAAEHGRAIPRAAFGGAGALLLMAFLLVRRVGKHDDRPTYIGTPGVESASGRDRVRSGELPPEYGSEHGR